MVSVSLDVAHASVEDVKKTLVMSWLERYDFPSAGFSDIVLVIPADVFVLSWNDTVRYLKRFADGYDPGNLPTSSTCLRFFVDRVDHEKTKFDTWLDVRSPASVARGRRMMVDRLVTPEWKRLLREITTIAKIWIFQKLNKPLEDIGEEPIFYQKFDFHHSQTLAKYRQTMRPFELGAFLLDQNEWTAPSYSDGVARTEGKRLNVDDHFGVVIRKCYARNSDMSTGGKFCGFEVDYMQDDQVLDHQVYWGDEKKSMDAMMTSMRKSFQELTEHLRKSK